MFAWIGTKLLGAKLWLFEAMAFVAVALGIYEAGHFKGSKSGAAEVEIKTASDVTEAVQTAAEVRATVAKAAPGASAKELDDEWTRKP